MAGPPKHNHPLDPLYEQFAEMFQAMANPKRLHILRCVSEREKSVSEILSCRAFTGVPQSTVSQNLATLRRQGLVRMRKDGTNVYYSLADPKITDLLMLVENLVERRVTEIRGVVRTGNSGYKH
jgi:ArsR family transcriptional regulator